MQCNKLSTHSIICVFLGYGESQKGYRCFDSISHKLYISCNVYFLKHIPFFSILVESHNVSKSELVHVDPFLDDINSFLTYINALVLDHYAPSPSTTTPTPSKVVDPLFPRSSQHFCKFTRLPNFVYSSYSDSFALFLAFIHNLSKPLLYREVVFDPLLQQTMIEELSTLYKTDTWNLIPLPPSKSVIGSR